MSECDVCHRGRAVLYVQWFGSDGQLVFLCRSHATARRNFGNELTPISRVRREDGYPVLDRKP